jgi:hypothetical protein
MRRTAWVLVAAVAAGLLPVHAGAPAGAPDPPSSSVPSTVALYSPRPLPAGRSLRFVPTQLPRCFQPGARMCVNGWVWWCQCYSFGCHWTTGSLRC